MAEKADSAVTLTNEAVRWHTEDPAQARKLLAEALARKRDYEPAWRWLAELTEGGERRYCLDQAYDLRADPDTDRARRELRDVPARVPDAVADLVDPPRPAPPPGRRLPRKAIALTLAVLLLAVGGAWAALAGTDEEPVTVALVVGATGRDPVAARDVERAVRLQLDKVNETGSRHVDLAVYDDADDPVRAKEIAERVVASDALFVVGHGASETALAASPVYRAAGLPAITPTASASRVTDESDWYFRSTFGDQTQAEFQAAYLARVLDVRAVTVVYSEDESGRSAQAAFRAAFAHFGDATALTVARARQEGLAGPTVLATGEPEAAELIAALRRVSDAPVVTTANLATERFHDVLKREGLTQGVHLATPLAADSLSGPAIAWAEEFRARYGDQPSWPAATARQAVNVGLHAVATGGLGFTDRAADRRRVREVWAGLKDRRNSFPALLGPLYFSPTGSAQTPVSFVHSDGRRLVSAPDQLTLYDPPTPEALRQGEQTGEVVSVGERHLARKQVVTTGVNLNEVRDLDTRDGTYFVDFFLWLKYSGDPAASDVQFVNAVKPDLRLGEPLRDVTGPDGTYRLYRVADRFKNGFEFRSFPFDHQLLKVLLQNRTRTADQVVYVTDREILDQPPEHHLRSGADADATIDGIPNWLAVSARFFQRAVGSSDALGDTSAGASAGGIYYSQYATEVEIARDTLPFLLKNLLPLILLITVTYLSLFFKAGDGAAPVSMGVTAILSTAVLLNNVTSQLPSVSYTVALEWGYYSFILLATACVLVAMLRKRFAAQHRDAVERRLGRAARIGYPAYLLAVVATYVVVFS
ncbi:ABC transporter substrate-binding protein [Actinosynnema sp. NPDC020468]|uniref:ABC transporter substrate-binding protein n=1 Tax=Actinosynnema sp. NPDC020468 TaxID=3154488 RepID=UPI00340A8949